MQYTQILPLSLDRQLATVSHNFLLKLLFFLAFFQIGLIICNSNLTSRWAIFDFYDIFFNIVIMIFALCDFKSVQLYATLVFWGVMALPAKLLYGIIFDALFPQSLNDECFKSVYEAFQDSLFAPTYLNFFLITLTSWKLVLLILVVIFHIEHTSDIQPEEKENFMKDEKAV